jgi:nickel/cobalt exporter
VKVAVRSASTPQPLGVSLGQTPSPLRSGGEGRREGAEDVTLKERHFYLFVFIIVFALFLAVLLDPAFAQTPPRRPFGVGEAAPAAAAPGGWMAWMYMKQAEFTRSMIAALRAARDGAGMWALISVAFAYGVFHAAGPGHGKAVVMSYVFANEQAIRRGVGVALAAAILQALVAIAIVLPAVLLIGATARQIDATVSWIEIISFSAIVLLGLTLIYRKSRALRIAINDRRMAALAPAQGRFSLGAAAHDCAAPDHVHGPHCDHVHLPQAFELTGEKSWRDLAAVTVAAGSRPCSGAIILLAFALSVGAVAAGVAAVFAMAAGTAITTAGFAVGAVAAKSVTLKLAEGGDRLQLLTAILELVAAILVTLLGLALLMGYLSGA